MAAIKFRTFQGLAPKIDPELLGDEQAQTAQNVYLQSGKLVPIKLPTTVTTVAASQQTIFRYRNGGGTAVWKTWASAVNVIRGPIAADTKDRIYYVSPTDSKLKVWDTDAAERNVAIGAGAAPSVSSTEYYDSSTYPTCTSTTTSIPI